MNRSELPNTAFIDPTGANVAEVRALAEQVLERVLEAAARAAARPPMPHAPTLEGIPTDIPDAPLSEDQLLEHLTSLIRGSMNPAHPGYLGHMDAIPTTVSVLGDLVAAAVNNNLLSLEMSPLFSRLETSLTQHMAHHFGLGEKSGGVMTAGGSLAKLHALAVARNTAFGAKEEGVVGLSRRPVILTSEAAHTSIQKAAMLLGLGIKAVARQGREVAAISVTQTSPFEMFTSEDYRSPQGAPAFGDYSDRLFIVKPGPLGLVRRAQQAAGGVLFRPS